MAKILRKTRAKLNARRNAHAALIKSLPSTVNPDAFKAPGSMKRSKG